MRIKVCMLPEKPDEEPAYDLEEFSGYSVVPSSGDLVALFGRLSADRDGWEPDHIARVVWATHVMDEDRALVMVEFSHKLLAAHIETVIAPALDLARMCRSETNTQPLAAGADELVDEEEGENDDRRTGDATTP